MYTWKEIWKDRCSTGKVKFTKREGQEALNKMQSNGKTYRENSSLYNCALCGFFHLTTKDQYSEEDKEQKPLIHGEEFEKLINNKI
jgi:hypothetical protein